MLRKKILIIGTKQDETKFLKKLDKVVDTDNVYKIDGQEVVIERSSSQTRLINEFPQSLNGYHAVISVNMGSINQSKLLDKILFIDEKDLSCYIYFGTDGKSSEYMKMVLNDIKNKNAYQVPNEPAINLDAFINTFKLVGTLFAHKPHRPDQPCVVTEQPIVAGTDHIYPL